MHYGFNAPNVYGFNSEQGYGYGTGLFESTNCYPTLVQLTDGGYGYDEAQATPGSITPDTTSDGTNIYSASIYSDGSFIMSFGVAGITQLTNTLLIIKDFSNDHVELTWNSTNLRYEGTNLSLATTVIAQLGTKVCFADIAIPDLLIDLDFEGLS